ncbi:SDR family oxidoreductase [Pseudorhodoplanes sp.]|jgi:NAD(P)-dependent dehydrogenase (short-subunit alcohol dehydrogenase family)|uniref:SDR family oxidoreductase n=1 Tax=Pseudorhodoplanes sp. TaxID=1934341 RepID=UPI002C287F02|nr:SDR family oxidoreductase [Pseudorhodoplanes sp.]HWV41919.1 SDR family oxidoreductase [Pseudorhodoplanes sp.]
MRDIVLITGGGRGIGAATARLAAARGYDVVINYRSNAETAAAVVRDIEQAGGRGLAVKGDMAKEEDVEALFKAVDSFGPLKHFVYNSGVTGKNSRFESVSTQTLRDNVDINLMGAFFCARAAIPRLSTKHGKQGGSMVFLGSVQSKLGAAGEYVWYAATKSGVDALVTGLSKELAGEGIRVNCVSPGPIDTEIHEPGRLARIAHQLPSGRVGRPEEVAEAILFLISDAASYTSGTILTVSGAR